MAQALGNAGITWVDPTDTTGTERVHLLTVPLRELTPGYSQSAWTADSLDRTTRETYSVGAGAHELAGKVRYDRNNQGLLDLVRAGMLNTTLTYYPNLNDTGVNYPVKLISPTDLNALTMALDSQRGMLGDGQVEVRFRRTDQASLNPLYVASPVLFRYAAGGSLAGSTFTRAGTAYYAAKGISTLTQAASGAARIDWWDLDGDGACETPALLLERASTNLVAYSVAFGSWTAVNSPTLTGSQADPLGTTTATNISDTGGATQEYVKITPTFTGNAAKAVSVFLKAGTTQAAGGSYVQLTDTTATADRLLAVVTWVNGAPSVAMTTGTYIGAKRYTGGWYRLLFQTTSVTAANTNVMQLLPAGVAAQTGDLNIFGAQAEDSLTPSSYIPTAGSTVARVVDRLTFPAPYKVQTMTVYLRFVDWGVGTYVSSTNYLLSLGNTGSTASRFAVFRTSAGTIQAQVSGVATATTAQVTLGSTFGQIVELVATFRVTGTAATAQVQAAVNGTLSAATAVTSAAAVNDGFLSTILSLNNLGGATSDSFCDYLNVLVTRGVVDYLGCRRLAGVQL